MLIRLAMQTSKRLSNIGSSVQGSRIQVTKHAARARRRLTYSAVSIVCAIVAVAMSVPDPAHAAFVGASISGTLVASDGTPISAAVQLYQQEGGTVASPVATATDGSFTLPAPSGSTVKLGIRTMPDPKGPAFMNYETEAVTATGAMSLGTLTLPPTTVYRVRFLDSIGQPIENAQLGGSAETGDVGWSLTSTLKTTRSWVGLTARTGSDGIIEFRGDAPSGWAMSASYTDPTDSMNHFKWVESRNAGEDGFITVTFDDLIAPHHPSPPQSITASAGDGQVGVSWAPPTTDGGAPVTAYEVGTTIQGQTQPVRVMGTSGSTTHLDVTGLKNGVRYVFTVVARNAVGPSLPSATDAVTPAAPPARPTAPRVARGDRKVTLHWSAPAGNGAAISAYVVTASPGGKTLQVRGSARSASMTGLSNGTAYRFTLVAKNAVGASTASPRSGPVVPAGRPTRLAKPRIAVHGHNVTVKWTTAKGNGSPIRNYIISSSTGYRRIVGLTIRTTFRRIRRGRHPFTVQACNAVGCSQRSPRTTAIVR